MEAVTADVPGARAQAARTQARARGGAGRVPGRMEPTGAAAVIIGNEVLTAKVVDANGPHLIRRLREVGIPLRTLEIVPDEVDVIVEAVARARLRAQYVFTSGGIGPTHDDVTVRAVALAMGRKVVRLPEMVELIRAEGGGRADGRGAAAGGCARGRGAPRPAGELVPGADGGGRVHAARRAAALPLQLETVLARLRGTPVHLRCLYLAWGRARSRRCWTGWRWTCRTWPSAPTRCSTARWTTR